MNWGGIAGIMARDRRQTLAVTDDSVFALPDDTETSLLKHLDSPKVVHSRKFRHV
jgi:hypothetical protein